MCEICHTHTLAHTHTHSHTHVICIWWQSARRQPQTMKNVFSPAAFAERNDTIQYDTIWNNIICPKWRENSISRTGKCLVWQNATRDCDLCVQTGGIINFQYEKIYLLQSNAKNIMMINNPLPTGSQSHSHPHSELSLAEVQIVELFPIIADHIVVFIGRLIAHPSWAAVHSESRVAQQTVNRTARYRVLAIARDKITAHGTQMLGGYSLAGCTSLMNHFGVTIDLKLYNLLLYRL